MDVRELRKQVAAIQKERLPYRGEDSLVYGLRRAEFEEQQYRRLLELAKSAPDEFSEKRRKVWERGVERSRASQERFSRLMNEREAAARTVSD